MLEIFSIWIFVDLCWRKECSRRLKNAASETYFDDDPRRNLADKDGSTTSRLKRTDRPCHCRPLVPDEAASLSTLMAAKSSPTGPAEEIWKVDAEVGKAHHMRVACRRQHRSGAIPGRQYYASPLSQPLTHPQPCWAWSMIMTWQQVEIMRGESPKSYVRVVRG